MSRMRRAETWIRTHPVWVDTIQATLFLLALGIFTFMADAGSGLIGPIRYEDPSTGDLAARPNFSFWPVFPHTLRVIALMINTVALCASWAIRRYNPKLSVIIAIAACVFQLIIPADAWLSDILVPFIIYSAASHGPRPVRTTALVAGLVGSVLAVLFFLPPDVDGHRISIPAASVLILHWLIVATVWLIGRLVQERRKRREDQVQQVQRLLDEQIREKEFAASDERRRIAREMHDVVAHSLSVIIAQADGGRYAASTRPELASEVLETVSRTGRDALTEMRSLLGILRDEETEAERAPAPNLARLDELAYTASAAGLETTVQRHYTPAGALPSGAELACYRIVQEALTNVRKHAVGATYAKVTVVWTEQGITLVITNDALAESPASDGLGRGQIGIRERAELYHGEATFSVIPDGYQVHVQIPYQQEQDRDA